MNRIKLEIFGSEAECLIFESDGSEGIKFEFTEPHDGFISIDGIVKILASGECVFDSRLLSDGEYEPTLILKREQIKLPKIKKAGKRIRLAECGSDFVRRISLRERRLAERVKSLEERLEVISKSVYGSTLF